MARTRKRLIWNIVFNVIFLFCFVCFIFSLKGAFTPLHFSGDKPSNLQYDEFDPSLMRLNTMAKLENYCDSLYQANLPRRTYPGIISDVLRAKFYHGYSYYNTTHNPMAAFIAPLFKKGMAAIVMPNDIVKYPYAACSQQSIVGMELFKRIGYPVRKVTMYDNVTQQGHFAYEVFYGNEWHYFDHNMEPDAEVLKSYNRPSVAFLNAHPDVIALAYRKKDPALFQRLLLSGQIGPSNVNPAPFATMFQVVTKYTSYFGWIIVGLFMLIRYMVLARKAVFSFAKFKRRQGQFQRVGRDLQGQEARA